MGQTPSRASWPAARCGSSLRNRTAAVTHAVLRVPTGRIGADHTPRTFALAKREFRESEPIAGAPFGHLQVGHVMEHVCCLRPARVPNSLSSCERHQNRWLSRAEVHDRLHTALVDAVTPFCQSRDLRRNSRRGQDRWLVYRRPPVC